MLSRISKVIISGRLLFAFLWVVVAIAMTLVAPNLQDEANRSQVASSSQSNAESVKARELIAQSFPQTQETMNNQVMVTLFRPGGITQRDRDYAKSLEGFISAHGKDIRLKSIASPFSNEQYAASQLSQDKQAALITLNLDTAFATSDSGAWLEQINKVIPQIREYLADTSAGGSGAPTAPADLQVHLTGGNAIQQDVISLQEQSLSRTLLMTLIFILVILLFVYRSPVAVIFPLLGVVFALTISQGVLGFAAHAGLSVSPNALIFLIIVLFGAGTDSSLLMLSRFRENVLNGQEQRQALRNAIPAVAEAVLSSSFAVIVAFGCMWFAQDFSFRGIGPPLAIAVFIELIVIMTFIPAVIAILGEKVFWPFLPSKTRARRLEKEAAGEVEKPGFWDRLSRSVVAKPTRYIVIIVVVLLPFVGLLTRFTYDNNEMRALLPTTTDSYKGLEVLRNHFGQGAGAENAVAVIVKTDKDLWSGSSLRALDELTAEVGVVPGVSKVATATRPTGELLTPPRLRELDSAQGGSGVSSEAAASTGAADGSSVFSSSGDAFKKYPGLRTLAQQYISADGKSVILNVTLASDPYSDGSLETVTRVRSALDKGLSSGDLQGSRAYAGGVSAEVKDNLDTQRQDFIFIIIIVLFSLYIILMLLLRSVVAPLYMVGTIALSFAATMGLTFAVFKYGLGFDGLWFDIPVVGFVILVALGIDYSIFLMARVKEEYSLHGRSTKEAVRVALARTGSVITSCGVIMAGTFTSLILSGINTFVEMGFAIVVGLLLDTFVIRTLLLPAIAVKLGERNWWPGKRPTAAGAEQTDALDAPVQVVSVG